MTGRKRVNFNEIVIVIVIVYS
eukprot:COSAG02_NODE_51350_length_314_cov_1.344186_1_plen_21_part_10